MDEYNKFLEFKKAKKKDLKYKKKQAFVQMNLEHIHILFLKMQFKFKMINMINYLTNLKKYVKMKLV